MFMRGTEEEGGDGDGEPGREGEAAKNGIERSWVAAMRPTRPSAGRGRGEEEADHVHRGGGGEVEGDGAGGGGKAPLEVEVDERDGEAGSAADQGVGPQSLPRVFQSRAMRKSRKRRRRPSGRLRDEEEGGEGEEGAGGADDHHDAEGAACLRRERFEGADGEGSEGAGEGRAADGTPNRWPRSAVVELREKKGAEATPKIAPPPAHERRRRNRQPPGSSACPKLPRPRRAPKPAAAASSATGPAASPPGSCRKRFPAARRQDVPDLRLVQPRFLEIEFRVTPSSARRATRGWLRTGTGARSGRRRGRAGRSPGGPTWVRKVSAAAPCSKRRPDNPYTVQTLPFGDRSCACSPRPRPCNDASRPRGRLSDELEKALEAAKQPPASARGDRLYGEKKFEEAAARIWSM